MENKRASVVITRPLSGLLNALPLFPRERFSIYPCPTIKIRALRQNPVITDIFRQIPTFDFAIFTSQIAVTNTVDYLNALGFSLKQFNRLCVCAVGPITARRLNKFGIDVDIIPHRYTAQALAEVFPEMRTYAPRILFPRGNMSNPVLANELKRKGYRVTSPVLYITEPRSGIDGRAKYLIESEQADCIAFTSPSSVVAFKKLVGDGGFAALSKTATVAAIGSVTAAACAEAGALVAIQPEEYTIRALANEISSYFEIALR